MEQDLELQLGDDDEFINRGIYHLIAFEFKFPFQEIAVHKLPLNKKPIEIVSSAENPRIVLVGFETSILILHLLIGQEGEVSKFQQIRDVDLRNQGNVMDFSFTQNHIYAKSFNNDIIEMIFPSNI